MKQVGVFDAKNRFSEVCETVAKTGEPVLVTRHGRPLVRIVPVADEAEDGIPSVWDTVEEGRARYGALTEQVSLPDRSVSRNRPSPLDEGSAQ